MPTNRIWVNADRIYIDGVLLTATPEELNVLDGLTATTAELNTLDGITASTAELNIMDGVTVTASDINQLASGIVKVEQITLTAATHFTASEVTTSFTFPSKAIVYGGWIDMTTGAGSGTIDVGTDGTSNDPDGILDGLNIASSGIKVPDISYTNHSLISGRYVSSTRFGALTHEIELGGNSDTTGNITARPASVGGDSITVTTSVNNSGGSGAGTLFITYLDLT